MGELIVMPADPATLDDMTDPAGAVIAMLNYAKGLLARARVTDLPAVAEARARADAIRCYVVQKNLGHEAELDAAEIVRRAERRIAELIRDGQAAGEILRVGQCRSHGNQHKSGDADNVGNSKPAPSDFAPKGVLESKGAYAMTDGVTAEEFEDALDAARAEQNLSRSNVIGKIRGNRSKVPLTRRMGELRELAAHGHSAQQIAKRLGASVENVRKLARENEITLADEIIGRGPAIDSNRVINETVLALESAVAALDLVDLHALDPDRIERWAFSLRSSLRNIKQFIKEMSK